MPEPAASAEAKERFVAKGPICKLFESALPLARHCDHGRPEDDTLVHLSRLPLDPSFGGKGHIRSPEMKE